MRPGTIVYTGKSRKGAPLVVRYPKMSDAPALLKHINTLSRERTFLSRQGRQISLKAEKTWLKNSIEQARKNRTVHLLAFSGKKLAGGADITQKMDALVPQAEFGLALNKEFRGEGIGTLLMKLALKEAKRMKGLKVISLSVYSGNRVARDLYKRAGFKEYGILPKSVLRRGKYEDDVFMYKKA